MERGGFTDQQIAFALQQAEAGTKVIEVCRKMGVTESFPDRPVWGNVERARLDWRSRRATSEVHYPDC